MSLPRSSIFYELETLSNSLKRAKHVLDTGNAEIVIISRQVEPYDTECLASLGIDPRKSCFLVLKSRIHYRATFAELAGAIVECAGIGVCTSDYGQLKFAKVRRPIYPLDIDDLVGLPA